MALDCLSQTCTGKVYTGQRGRQFYWEGETYSCRKCGREYVAHVTDDYEDDRIPYLVAKDEVRAPTP